MKKQNVYAGIAFASFLAVGVIAVSSNNLIDGRSIGASQPEDYKMVLNKDNYATIAEVGTFAEPINTEKYATRKTALGNDIVFQFCSGKGITFSESTTTSATKFCQMPGYQYGWVTNKTPITGITKLKVTVQQASAVFRVDMSSTNTLENYYYSAERPSHVTYRSEEYTGSTSYEIPFDGQYKYFRLQNLSVTLSLTSLEIYYACSSSETFRGELRTNATPIEIKPCSVSRGGTITVDYKYVDPVADKDNGVSIFLGTDLTNCFGSYKIFHDRLDGTYDGVTFYALSDGYKRLVFDVSSLATIRSGCVAPTEIDNVLFRWFEPNGGIYFDVKSEPVEETPRGYLFKNGNTPYSLSKNYKVSDGGTITVDYKFADSVADKDNGVSLFFGSDDTNRFGNYKILKDGLEQTYAGVTSETLSDGYIRLTVNISQLNAVRTECVAPTIISEISFRWFEVTEGVYFDVNPDEKIVKTTEFTMDDSEFVIANFTDVHVTDESMLGEDGTTGKTIRYGIANSNPDIIVFSGDVVGAPSDLNYFCKFMDSFKIPYFVILGNHDHEGSLGYEPFAQRIGLSTYGYIEKGPEDLGSQGNYTVKIKNSEGDLVHSIVLMDTGNKYTVTDDSLVEYVTNPVSGVKYGTYNGKKTYCDPGWNGLRGNQIDWYESTVRSLGCETTLICHIPSLEFTKAFEQYQDAVNKGDSAAIAACAPIGQCNMGEPSCGSMENLGLFQRILDVNSTKNIITGHDHLNDFSLMYQGVRLTYSVKTGEGSYWKNDGTRCGYTELAIDNVGHTTLDQVYYNPLTA